MAGRQQIQEIPEALRSTLELARAEYGALARRVRWGDGPLYVTGAGEIGGLCKAAPYAFATHLGWPLMAGPAGFFKNYGAELLRPRSALLMICTAGEWPEAQDLAVIAHERGCTLAVLTNAPEGALAKTADHVFPVHGGAESDSPGVTVCMHVALNLLAFETMRALKKPKPWWDAVAKDFEQLPDKLEWAFAQLGPVIRSAAAELQSASGLSIVAGGFLHYPAWHAARRTSILTNTPVEGVEATEPGTAVGRSDRRHKTVMFVSGSHSKMKKLIHRRAAEARAGGSRVLCMTDANDRALAENSDLGILIPEMQEAPASTLALFMLEWLAMELARAANTQK